MTAFVIVMKYKHFKFRVCIWTCSSYCFTYEQFLRLSPRIVMSLGTMVIAASVLWYVDRSYHWYSGEICVTCMLLSSDFS